MGSFAVWAERLKEDDAPAPPEIEMHFNFWYEYQPKSPDPALDIGILVHDFVRIESLNIFVPFTLKQNALSDLGKSLMDTTTLNAVFNENYHIDAHDNKACLVHGEKYEKGELKKDERFLLYALDMSQDVELKNNQYNGSNGSNKGTTVKIDISKLADLHVEKQKIDCRDGYFRFRIMSSELKSALIKGRSNSKTDALFHDVLSLTQIVEFRLNHSRSLPESLRETVRSCGDFLEITTLHFFLLMDGNVDFPNQEKVSIRYLEDKVWSNYLPKNQAINASDDFSNVIAYHWKKVALVLEERFIDWDLCAKIKIQHRNIRTILLYIAAILVLGALGSIIGSALYYAIGNAYGLLLN